MDPSDAIQVLVLLALIGLSAFFSSAETALVTVNKIRIRNLIDEGSKRALTLSKVTEDQGKMLSAILIGNNIVNISASSSRPFWSPDGLEVQVWLLLRQVFPPAY